VKFAKRGDWSEFLTRRIPKDDRLVISLDLLAREKICLVNEYMVSRAKAGELYSPKTATILTKHNSDFSTMRSGDPSVCSSRPTFCGFPLSDMVAILFSILYPAYAACEELSLAGDLSVCFRTRSKSIENEDNELMRLSKMLPARIPEYSRFVRDTVLECAQQLNEQDLSVELTKPTFSSTVLHALDAHPMAITIVDTKVNGFPIVYANAVFQELSGYTLKEILNRKKNILVMCGPDTESCLVALLHEALSKSQSAKVAMTSYTRKKRPFIDMIALRSSGRYSVAVHFPVSKESNFDDLQMVDKLLTFLALIVQPHATSQSAAAEAAASAAASASSPSPSDTHFTGAPRRITVSVYPLIGSSGSDTNSTVLVSSQMKVSSTAPDSRDDSGIVELFHQDNEGGDEGDKLDFLIHRPEDSSMGQNDNSLSMSRNDDKFADLSSTFDASREHQAIRHISVS